VINLDKNSKLYAWSQGVLVIVMELLFGLACRVEVGVGLYLVLHHWFLITDVDGQFPTYSLMVGALVKSLAREATIIGAREARESWVLAFTMWV
jgi:hypothetical protein